jgi:hypothetical protein
MDWELILILALVACAIQAQLLYRRYVILRCRSCRNRLESAGKLVHTCKPCQEWELYKCQACATEYWVSPGGTVLARATNPEPWNRQKLNHDSRVTVENHDPARN